jgi:hypothetical protein
VLEGQVRPSSRNKALAALLFLYRELLELDLDLEGVVRAVLERMDGAEALRLRVKNLDFEHRKLTMRNGKGSDASAGMRIGSGLAVGVPPAPALAL